MTWIKGDKDDEEFINELANYPDRIVGLLAPAIVDKRLERAIRARWTDIPNDALLKDLFRDGGPLGSFAIRIKIGFAIRIYGKDAYNDLRSLNKIRNAFAHKVAAKDFNDESIKDRSNKLLLPSKYLTSSVDTLAGTLAPMFEPSTDATFFDVIAAMGHHAMLADPTDARGRFVRTCEILCWFLWSEEVLGAGEKIPGFPPVPPPPRF
jgi:hypothetical protein